MANRTVKEAATVKGTNPQYLVEKIIRTRIYDSLYWKEQCFGLSAEDLVDKGLDLRYVGGVFSGNVKPTPFLCLCLKMLQLQPEKDIAVEFIRQEDSKYIRALGAMYIRLTLSSVEIYKYLEPLYNDYRRMRFMNKQGRFELVHMDDFIDHLLREERYCDVQLPRLQKRQALEEVGELQFYVSALDEDIERATSSEEEEEEDDRRRKERPKLVSRRPGRDRSRSKSRERSERSSKRDRSRDREDRDRRDRDRKDRDRHKDRDSDKHHEKSSKNSKEDDEREIEEANALRAKLAPRQFQTMEALLKNPKVRMRDQKAVEAKIAKIVADGSENLIVISDFDYTLSRYKDTSGSICSSSHGVFHSAADKADHVLAEKLNRSKAKFMAVETCHIMTIDEKIPHMVEWWNTSHECIKEAKLHKDVIEEIVLDSKSMIVLRDRAIEFFELLQAKSVPLVIFSAGVGTVIDIFLRPRLTKHQMNNVHIISNMMIFDEEGICVDFSEPLIHVFCKNGSAVRHDDPFFHSFSTRQNVVLLGDSTGDLEMHVGVERSGVVLKIGFLNHKFEELLDKYLAEGAYDIVIVDDQSVDIPLALLSEVPTTELSNKTDDDVTNSNKESSKAVENKAPSVAFFLCIRVLPLTSIRGVAPAGFTGQQGSSQRNRSGWLTERYCDIQLSRLQKRQALEEVGELKLCLYVLDEDIERATSPEEEEEGDDRRRKERPKTTTNKAPSVAFFPRIRVLPLTSIRETDLGGRLTLCLCLAKVSLVCSVFFGKCQFGDASSATDGWRAVWTDVSLVAVDVRMGKKLLFGVATLLLSAAVVFAHSHSHSHDPEPAHLKYSRAANEAAQEEVKRAQEHHHGHSHEDGGCPHDHSHSHEYDHGHSHEEGHGHSHSHSESPKTYSKRSANIHSYDPKGNFAFMNDPKTQLWVYAFGATVLISVFPFLVLTFIPVQSNTAESGPLLKLLLSFGAGGLLGDAFLHLIPHASPSGGHSHSHSHSHEAGHSHEPHDMSVGLWVLAGIIIFLFIEKFVRIFRGEDGHGHSHGGHGHSHAPAVKKDKCSDDEFSETTKKADKKRNKKEEKAQDKENEQPTNIRVAALLNMVADFCHNFTDGLAIGASFIAGPNIGLVTMITVLVHEIPHEIGDFAILVQSGVSKPKAMMFQLITAFGAVVGCWLAVMSADPSGLADAAASSWVLPFTAGGFIYIATVTIMPDLLEKSSFVASIKELVTMSVGIYSMYLIGLYE